MRPQHASSSVLPHRTHCCACMLVITPIASTPSLPADLATLLVVFSLLVLDRVAYTLGSPLLKAVLHTG